MSKKKEKPVWRAPGLQDMPLGLDASPPSFRSDEIEHSVWDEPALQGMPIARKGEFNYASWIQERQAQTSEFKSWVLMLGIALLSGPWGVITYFLYGQNLGWGDYFAAALIAPLIQEMSKIALLLWVIEKKPYWVKGWFQIFTCSLASATFFVSLFNWVGGWMGTHPFGLWFQWTAFFLMHLLASTISAVGIERVWHPTAYQQKPPVLEAGFHWFRAAFLINAGFTLAVMIVARSTDLLDWLSQEVRW